MMLQRRYDHLVTWSDELAPVPMHHKVNSLGTSADKDAFFYISRVNKPLYLFARAFICSRSPLAQVMHAPVDVGMFLFQITTAAIDDNLRHLRRRCVVEINQRSAVNMLAQHREILAHALHIPIDRLQCP